MDYDAFIVMIAESLGLDKSKIFEDTSFLKDMGVDSLTLSNFVIKLERKFNVQMNVSNIWDLKTVRDAYNMFNSALNSPNKAVK